MLLLFGRRFLLASLLAAIRRPGVADGGFFPREIETTK
jgi:hypothetical protein